ncbi:hypothetical protein [Nocardioides sp.]|jgi:hypothetical protein|uniref:hypothetical protein n=1 Tax=Nocardioides sp. TaxID=35761 RepID=UPI002F3FCF3F
MTEQVPPTGHRGDEPEEQSETADEPTATGVPAVDEVLSEVDGLDDLPLEEHLPTFERVHESLRAALDAPSADQPGDPA